MELEQSESSNKQCSIGCRLNEECHKKVYGLTSGIKLVKSLLEKERQLLEWRTSLKCDETDDICLHHQRKYVSQYERLQNACCDPLQCHKALKRSEYQP